MRNNKCNATFYTYNISNSVVKKLYFSLPNNTKYLVPSKTLIKRSILSNLIHKSLALVKLLYKML